MVENRISNGRFAAGNSGGPGRPKRLVESDYLATLSAAVPLETWQRIVAKAVADAEAGDAKSRDWLGKYLMGTFPYPLAQLANSEGNV